MSGEAEKKEVVRVPDLGEGAEIIVGEIFRGTGDLVQNDEDLVELLADKASIILTSSVSGAIAALLVNEGDAVEPGRALVEIKVGGER